MDLLALDQARDLRPEAVGPHPPHVGSPDAPAHSRTTIAVHDPALGVGRDQAVSAVVEIGVGIIVERPIYFRYGPGWTGGHVALGHAG